MTAKKYVKTNCAKAICKRGEDLYFYVNLKNGLRMMFRRPSAHGAWLRAKNYLIDKQYSQTTKLV